MGREFKISDKKRKADIDNLVNMVEVVLKEQVDVDNYLITEQKIADAKKKLEEAKKKTEKEKKLDEQSTKDKSEKEKQQQEKKVGELIENPEN
jgi:hypothetical protein